MLPVLGLAWRQKAWLADSAMTKVAAPSPMIVPPVRVWEAETFNAVCN